MIMFLENSNLSIILAFQLLGGDLGIEEEPIGDGTCYCLPANFLSLASIFEGSGDT